MTVRSRLARRWPIAGRPTGLLWRYALAAVGPIGSAGAQFLLNLVLLARLDAPGYGRFTFLFTVAQFGASIWSALFCAPLPALLAGLPEAGRRALVRGIATANLSGAFVAAVALLGIARLVGEPSIAAIAFAAYAALSLLRWFSRALAYALGRQLRATASDIAYTLALLAGTATLALAHGITTTAGYHALAIAIVLGLVPFVGMLPRGATDGGISPLRHYRAMWRQHGRWSLLGVVSTELTVNAHTYLVTTFLGAAAFAPLAASTLAVRPVFVVTNALMEFERARFAILGQQPETRALRHGLSHFRRMLLLAWLGNGVVLAGLFAWWPTLLFPSAYDPRTLALGAGLWMVSALVRILRAPENTVLQSVGEFRPLALMTCWSSALALAATAALLMVAAPIWSILGVMLGECVVTLLVVREARRVMQRREPIATTTPGATIATTGLPSD